jgi:2',3'-cyclic-nucleotide 2'-phosphodiesterase (5'-nucleotidase family)
MRCGSRLVLGLLLFTGLASVRGDVRPLTILHSNDLHSRFLPDSRGEGGFAYLAAALRRELHGCRWCLVLNAGDLAQGTPASTIYRGLPVFEVLNLFRPDVSTLGNHEFDYGWQRIQDFLRTARFPIVSANVVDGSNRLLADGPYVIRTVNGIRVGVIGALTASLPELTLPEQTGPWRAQPVLETVRRYARQLRGRTDLVVVLAHITGEEEDQLLREAPEVAVVVSGHVHVGLQQPKVLDNRLVVRVRSYGVEFGRLDMKVDQAADKVESWNWRRIPVRAADAAPARDVARAVQQWEDKVSKIVDLPIGESKREFTVRELKTLMEQSMAESMGADLAFMNLGGIRDVLPKGQILARHVWNIMPFDNRLMMGTVKGRDLPVRVTEGRPIDPDREYTLVVNEFVAANQETELGVQGLAFPRLGPLHRDQLIDWIKKKKVIE